MIYIRLIIITKKSLLGNKELHKNIISKIINAPINLYHDITPRSQIINNLSEHNLETELRLKSLIFINMIINYCHPSKLPRILIELKDIGIFALLEKNLQQEQKNTQKTRHEGDFEDQINMFKENILIESDRISITKNESFKRNIIKSIKY